MMLKIDLDRKQNYNLRITNNSICVELEQEQDFTSFEKYKKWRESEEGKKILG